MNESGTEPGTGAALRSQAPVNQAPLVLLLTVGVLAVGPLIPFDSLRAVLTLPIAVFAPGVVLRAAITRRFERPDVPRLAEAAVVSLASLGLIVIAFYFLRIAIAPAVVSVTLAALIAIVGGVAIVRSVIAPVVAVAPISPPAAIVWPAPAVTQAPAPSARPVAHIPRPQTVARAMRSTTESARPVAVRPMHAFTRTRRDLDRAELQALRERVLHLRR